MSKAEWAVVALGVAAVATAACYPPYRFVFPSGYVYAEGPTYAPLWSPPPPRIWGELRVGNVISGGHLLTPVLYWRRLAVEWAAIAAAAAVVLAVMAGRRALKSAHETHPRGLPYP